MKHHEILFSLLKIPLDFLLVFWAFFIAKQIRLITDLIPWVHLPIQTIDTTNLSRFAFFWACIYTLLFASHRLYSLQISHSKIQEILDVVRYGIYWFIFFSVAVYLGNGIVYEGNEIPRLIILFTMVLSILGSILVRIFINFLQSSLIQQWKISQRNLLLITHNSIDDLRYLIEDITASKIYKLVWYANSHAIPEQTLPYVGGVDVLRTMMKQHAFDEILYTTSDFSKKELYKIWELSRIYGIRYRYITNNFEITQTNTTLTLINQTPAIEIQNTPLEHWWRVGKRWTDIIISLAILIIGTPLFLIIALLIKLEDPAGPIIYKNRRIGQQWSIFNCYKFRYLKWKYCTKESYGTKNEDDPAIEYEQKLISENSSRSGPLYKISQDPRKTRIGTFLEKYSLDELPQFFNVLTWEMSIVGPRPHQPREVEHYKEHQERLLTIKPGITGMAQVNGREQNNFEKESKLDIFYIENWTFLLDLKIMLKTLAIVLTRK